MKNLIIVLIILVVVVVGAYLIFANNNSYQIPASTTQSNTTPVSNPVSNTTVPVSTTTQAASVPATPVKTTPAPVPVTPKPPVVSNATVSISNFSFNPSTLTVRVGTKVTWTNNDSVTHTVTSDSGNILNSGALSPGQSYSVTFASPGSISYHCSIHPMMRGTIVVTN